METIKFINMEQNKVLVILVRVKKAQLFVISLPGTDFKENYMVHTWIFSIFYVLEC